MKYLTFWKENAVLLFVLLFVGGGIAGCVADNVAGSFDVAEAIVSDKFYDPPRTEVHSRWVYGDGEHPGHLRTYTEHIPARYYILTAEGILLSVTAGQYARLEERERIVIRHKVGRWTGIHYPWQLADVQATVER